VSPDGSHFIDKPTH